MIRTGLGLKLKIKKLPWRVALFVLPQPLLYELWHKKSLKHRRPEEDDAKGNRIICPQDGVKLEIYWSEVPNVGCGPSASLFVLDEEVLRLDCFGDEDGHMHMNPLQLHVFGWSNISRIRFSPRPVLEQIERGAFELRRNAGAATALNMLRRVRDFSLDPNALNAAAQEMAKHMRALTEQNLGAACMMSELD